MAKLTINLTLFDEVESYFANLNSCLEQISTIANVISESDIACPGQNNNIIVPSA